MLHTLDYSVWAESQVYLEEPPQTKQVARFTFLLDACDYAMELQQHGVRCVLLGPPRLSNVYEPKVAL